jgi:hypothetical protein
MRVREIASFLMGLILLLLLLPPTSGSAISDDGFFGFQERIFTDLARANPGICGNATASVNDTQINIMITPKKYASEEDLCMALGSIVRGYGRFLETSPYYIGYLSVRLHECGKTSYLWEISAFRARTAMANGGDDLLVQQFISNKKVYARIAPPQAHISHTDL